MAEDFRWSIERAVSPEKASWVQGFMTSVAGFDDTDLAAVVWPPLTTIRQPVRDLGYAAADLLLAPKASVEQRLLPHALIVRGSVAKR